VTSTTTTFGPDALADDVRSELRTWIMTNWDPESSLLEWRRRLVDAGWAAPTWPQRWYGRDLPSWADSLVHKELQAAGAIGTAVGSGMTLAAPTILAHGPDSVRERYLRPILTGEETWCQLFSEPDAGSDLAGLVTRASLDGDEWVVNGQKVWNTSAHHADLGMLLARTNWDVPKHKGLTYFVLPMDQPGVSVRPLRQMNYYSSFNEVFLSDARVPVGDVVGDVGDGWRAALTTLAFERRFGVMRRPKQAKSSGRAVDEARAEADDYFSTYKWYPQRAGRVDLVIERLKDSEVAKDPIVRQEVARLIAMQRISIWTAERAQVARTMGKTPGPEGSVGKLSTSQTARLASKVHMMISGASAMLTGPDSPMKGIIAEVFTSVPAQSIAGGTDEIQKNILGEKALGLPRDPSVDMDIPFRDIPHN